MCISFVAVGRSYVAFKMAALWFWTMFSCNPPIAPCYPLLWGGGILVDHWSTIYSFFIHALIVHVAMSSHVCSCFSVVTPWPLGVASVIMNYRQVSNIRCTLLGNKIVDHSDVVGASPVGAAPTTSSFWTEHLASLDSATVTARRDEKHLSLGIWSILY